VDESSETGLILDNHERNIHLTAQSRKPHDELDRVDIVSNENKLSLLVFNKTGNVLESVLDLVGSTLGCSSSGSSGSSSLLDTLLLSSRGLGTVLVQKLKDSHGLVLGKSLGELVYGRRDLEALVEDSTLTLDADILGPTDETGKVLGGADVSSDVEVTGLGGEEGVCLLGSGALYDLLVLGCHLDVWF